jgi:hypothetical protein
MEERYYKILLVPLLIIVLGLVFLCSPGFLKAQYVSQVPVSPPPIEAQFVRQGDFAAALAYTLSVTDGRNQAEAEDRLASLGIAPRNVWISDDPVTPDVIADLEAATRNAADTNRLPLSRNEALGRFIRVVEESGIAISPGAEAAGYVSSGPVIYPDQPYITDYYVSEGPPVITYYEPPPAYYDLYSWIPCPFWYGGVTFSGYYILTDHHRRGHHEGHTSNYRQDGTGYHRPVGQDHRYNGGMQGRNGSRPVGLSRGGQEERPHSTVSSANFPRNGTPAARRPVMSAAPRLSGTPQLNVRGVYRNPSATRPSMGSGTRFASARAIHPAHPAGSNSIRQVNSFGASFRQPAAGGWSRDDGGRSGGHGYAGFRR